MKKRTEKNWLPTDSLVETPQVSEETRRRITNETLIKNASTFGSVKAAYLPVTELYIPSDTYQRELHNTAKKMAEEFDDEKCGFLAVRYNPDKIMFEVIDGQHRFVAAKIAGRTCVPCHIITKANTVEKAARYFSQQDDNRVRLTLRDKFKAALVARDASCLRLNALCKEFLLEIIPSKEKTYAQIHGLRELMRIFALMGDRGVRETFSVIDRAKWHDQPGAYGEYILYSVGALLMGKLDRNEVMNNLVQAFRTTTPATIFAKAKIKYPDKTSKVAVYTYISDLAKA